MKLAGRSALAALAVTLLLSACSSARGTPVPIKTLDAQTCCWLSFSVVDVVADPSSGVPVNKATGEPFVWAAGFTAWRVGAEVEVRDASGTVVLTTGGRYWISPTYPDYAVGEVKPCSACQLGGGPL
jgi:hypothetical protein